MREISIEYSDYDAVAGKIIYFNEKGYLLAPNIVFSRDQLGMYFYYFNDGISQFEEVINVDNSKRVNYIISGGSIANIELEQLANMTIKQLAELLK
ncbi:hypothetical protein [Bacillus sp. FJAT-22090]|uniref:hypothetical protein n=1 Tax=Bacillus sp. FJAT-22090 TaxID=1581038 RepID=UPI0011A54ABB|nr:hypothetical protein [Bacillus sp. FJAT-22090]